MYEAVECHEYLELPALTIGVDGDGAGRTVILELEEMGIPVERIHWGLPCHSDAEKNRYFNLRAYAHCKMREAIFTGVQGAIAEKFVEQASRLPYRIDARGRYQMTPADKMKSDGIKSPDISDNCCFAFLLDYIPAEDGQKATVERDRFLELARARLGE